MIPIQKVDFANGAAVYFDLLLIGNDLVSLNALQIEVNQTLKVAPHTVAWRQVQKRLQLLYVDVCPVNYR